VFSALLTRLTAAAYDQLSETQRRAWLIATYDLAVLNGGHREYFDVFGVGRAAELRAAFEQLGAGVQRQILADAIGRHMSRPGETGFVDATRPKPPARRVDYSDLDAFYRGGQRETNRLLERYIRSHLGDFLEVEE
jgi:hypothetical protein